MQIHPQLSANFITGTKKEGDCCRCCLSSWSTLNNKPGQQTAVTPQTNFYRYFLLFTGRRWWKACGPPQWKTLWSNGTASDILLASHWSNLQSDWFRLMPTCPAETHKLRPPREWFSLCLLLLSKASPCTQQWRDNKTSHPKVFLKDWAKPPAWHPTSVCS